MCKRFGLAALLVFVISAGCASNAGPAISEHGPTADTGPLSGSTTGGDAAGTLNLKREEKPHDAGGH